MTSHVEQRYEEFIERLLDLHRRESSLAPLDACFEALGAVLRFLSGDARLLEGEATKPLNRLLFAILNRSRGAKPKLFFELPEGPDKSAKPTYTSSIIPRGYVNAAYLSLLEGSMSQKEASKWLAQELKRAGVKQSNGRAIDAKVIVRWRAELGGKAPMGSDEAFAILVHDLRGKLFVHDSRGNQNASDAPLTRQQAKSVAAVFIKFLKIGGF
jgi:hypothetical protein